MQTEVVACNDVIAEGVDDDGRALEGDDAQCLDGVMTAAELQAAGWRGVATAVESNQRCAGEAGLGGAVEGDVGGGDGGEGGWGDDGLLSAGEIEGDGAGGGADGGVVGVEDGLAQGAG